MRKCLHCGKPLGESRSDKKFCSTRCYQRHWHDRPPFPYQRECRTCSTPFTVAERADANRQYCSQKCAKEAARKGSITWGRLHPERQATYRATRIKKNPTLWRDKRREERRRILEILGSKCLACGAINPNWLHVDYVPTTRHERYRHSRTLKFTLEHPDLFRILCANHHYELTLTGKIEGTNIVQ